VSLSFVFVKCEGIFFHEISSLLTWFGQGKDFSGQIVLAAAALSKEKMFCSTQISIYPQAAISFLTFACPLAVKQIKVAIEIFPLAVETTIKRLHGRIHLHNFPNLLRCQS